jgi:tetratricopeptide (TPR) repeat protein
MSRTLCAATLAAACAVSLSAADKPATIEWGSSSKDAVQHVTAAIALMEQAAPGARYREAAEKAVAADPNFALAHFLVGLTYQGNERKPHMDKAQELAAKAPEGERAFIAASLTGDRDQAIPAFEALDKTYDEPLVSIRLGQLYLERYQRGKPQDGDLDKAKAALEAAIALNKQSARARFTLANVLVLKNEYAAAREHLAAALPLIAPGVPPGQVRYGTAMTYLYEGKSKDAIKALEPYVEEYRTSPSMAFPEVFVHNSIARIHLESGDAEQALVHYKKGFEAVKNSTTMKEEDKTVWLGRLHHGTGRSLAKLGKHKEAWAEADVVKKMIDDAGDKGKPYVEAYHYLAGYLKLEAGETAAAIEHLKQADAEDPFHKLLLARAYEKAGEKEKARAAYQEIVDNKVTNLERALSYPEAKKKLL